MTQSFEGESPSDYISITPAALCIPKHVLLPVASVPFGTGIISRATVPRDVSTTAMRTGRQEAERARSDETYARLACEHYQ